MFRRYLRNRRFNTVLTRKCRGISGSTSSYPITSNIYWSLFENYRNHPSYPESHAKTVESYKMLIDGETDVILVPDPGSEVKALAQERNVKLEYIPIAKEALVFFTSKYNRAENLSSSDIGEIYAENSVKNWNELGGPDAPFAAFCRNNDSRKSCADGTFFLKGREIHPDIRRERTSISMSNVLTDVEDYNRGAQRQLCAGIQHVLLLPDLRDAFSVR